MQAQLLAVSQGGGQDCCQAVSVFYLTFFGYVSTYCISLLEKSLFLIVS